MSTELVSFIPPEVRLEMAQRVIDEMGIRPLAREIGVNPKSVYKYKEGSARPGDKVMARILAVMKRDDPDLLEEYLNDLRTRFQEALEASIEPQEILAEVEGEPDNEGQGASSEGSGVAQESTPEAKEEVSVDQEETEELSLEEICDIVGVSGPFAQAKIEKIVNSLAEEGDLSLEEIMEWTGLSMEAVEDYLEQLVSEEFVNRRDSDKYGLSVKIRRSD